jgi:GNAT superfamily N-acetyltransferase
MLAEMAPSTPKQLAAVDRRYSRFVLREMKGKRMFGYLVETEGGEVAAGGVVWLRETPPRVDFPGGKIPYLMSMYTEPAYRGRGLATMIVKETIAWSRKEGYPWMMLHASAAGRGLYEKLGWEATAEMRFNITMAGH